MYTNYLDRLESALSESKKRYCSGFEIAFLENVSLKIKDNNNFGARIVSEGDQFFIEVNSATLFQIDQLWDQAWEGTILIDEAGARIKWIDGSKLTLDRLKHLSLTWLLLHELMHIQLGHLDLLDVAQLIETEDVPDQSNQIESVFKKELKTNLTNDELKLVRACLELQSDNEATEMMFGTYSESEWDRFRIEASAIFVVMALMEKADNRIEKESRTYPKVATRFFTLFAQLFQYWLYPGAELEVQNGQSYVKPLREPSGEEFSRYMKYVLAFTISDTTQIALWAEAKTFLIDLGEGAALFKDIFEVQYSDDLQTANLKTVAAQEWRKLLPINEKIMALSGLRES